MSKPKWTPEQDFKLARYLDEGWPYRVVAQKMKCSHAAIKERAAALGIRHGDRPNLIYTMNAVTARFLRGSTAKGILGWVERGWLGKPRVAKGGKSGKRAFRFTREQLEAFLEVQEAWVAWEPENLVDEGLRRWAIETRAAAGWTWVRATDAMREIGYKSDYTGDLIEEGSIDRSKCVRYATSWWVRSDELERFRATVPDRGPVSLEEIYGERVVQSRVWVTESHVRLFETWGDGCFAKGVRAVADYMMSRSSHAAAD